MWCERHGVRRRKEDNAWYNTSRKGAEALKVRDVSTAVFSRYWGRCQWEYVDACVFGDVVVVFERSDLA